MVDLSSLTAMFSAAGSVIGLANQANTVEANQQVIELQKTMAEVQRSMSELFQENQELKRKGRELQEELEAETRYPLRQGVRWIKSADGDKDDGPFCPVCFAKNGLRMPLNFSHREQGGSNLRFLCSEKHYLPSDVFVVDEHLVRPGRYRLDD
jgi:hypothetical protein